MEAAYYPTVRKASQGRAGTRVRSCSVRQKKIVISTNIAETSVTISDITTVIDTGLAKLNFYNPKTYTSSLNETTISKASCNQRKGRAGRTCPGTCYRLYPRKDYETRQMYTTEEIYRTDLSEVVLRMAELGITNFYDFDFISSPGREGIAGAVDTLSMLRAISPDHTLSPVGKLMVVFPLEPRISRIIVESIMQYPDVLEEVLVAASFLSANSPFVLPPGDEMAARRAHHSFRDVQGDFVSYLHIFRSYKGASNKEKFCKSSYLDERVMAEIENIDQQLTQIVNDMQIPVTGGGSMINYLCCIASGMIQFVCVREGRDNYRSLTADHICIHPGSSMFRQDPLYIVAGEIVRTSRMFAMSVSPLTKTLLEQIDPMLRDGLETKRIKRGAQMPVSTLPVLEQKKDKIGKKEKSAGEAKQNAEESFAFGRSLFEVKKTKGKRTVLLPWDKFKTAVREETAESRTKDSSGLYGKITFQDGFSLLDGEKIDQIIKIATALNLEPLPDGKYDRKLNIKLTDRDAATKLVDSLGLVLRVAVAKQKSKEYGFVCLFTDGNGTYWFKISRGIVTALNESLSSLEILSDDVNADFTPDQKEKVNQLYRSLNTLYD